MRTIIWVLFLAFFCTKSSALTDTPQINIGPCKYTIGFDRSLENLQSNLSRYYYVNIASNLDPNLDHDSYHVLKQALEDIEINGGGILSLSPGTYVVANNIALPNNTHFTGESMETTILQLAAFTPPFDRPRAGFLRSLNTHDIIISKLTLDGNKQNQFDDPTGSFSAYGIFTAATEDVWFDNVKVMNFQGYGFDPHGIKSKPVNGPDTVVVYGKYLTITNCVAINNDWDGFAIDQTLHVVVENCTATNNGRHGFNIITGSSDVLLSGNRAEGNGYYNTHSPSGTTGCSYMIQNNGQFGTRNVIISNNYANNSGKAAFCTNDVEDITFTSNRAEMTRLCFEFINTRSTSVENNMCQTDSYYKTEGSEGILFGDNTFVATEVDLNSDNANNGDDRSFYEKLRHFLTDWRAYIPLYILGLIRWGMFFLFRAIPAMFYRPMVPGKAPKDPYTVADVSIGLTLYEPPPSFKVTLSRMVRQRPAHVYIGADTTCFLQAKRICEELRKSLQEKDPELPFPVTVLEVMEPGKRAGLLATLKACQTRLWLPADDDSLWCETLMENIIIPFNNDERIGGVGCRHYARIRAWWDWQAYIADFRLFVRTVELRATTFVDKGCSCISGRSGCYLAKVLQTEEFYDYFINEKFCCGRQLQSGDDKCLTRYIVNKGYKTYHQLDSKCQLSTQFFTGKRFLKQLLRWSRNTWRSDLKALFLERDIWRTTPFTAFILLDKMITPLCVVFGIVWICVWNPIRDRNEAFIGWAIWLFISRVFRLAPYLLYKASEFLSKNPLNIINPLFYICGILYILAFIVFQWVQVVIRLYAFMTMYKTNWGTRSITVKNNVVVRKTTANTEGIVMETEEDLKKLSTV